MYVLMYVSRSAYVLAHRLCEPDGRAQQWQGTLGQLLPFIAEKSTTVLKSVQEAMNYVVARVREDLVH